MAGVAYLHGVEFLPVQSGVRSISVVRSSVIALTGVAPKGPINQLVLVQKSGDIAQFGSELPGFTIPQSLNAIYANQPTQVLVVNVFDPAVNITAVVKESVVIASAAGTTAFAPIGALTALYRADGATVIAAVLGTDYTISDFGKIKVLNTTLIPDSTIKISYNKSNVAALGASDIIGTDTSGGRTGMQLFKQAFSTFGFKPKQIIAPGYSNLTSVEAQMAIMATNYKAVYYVDAPNGTAVNDAISSRGPAGPIAAFNIGDKRGALLYPMPTAYDAYTDDDQIRPYSAFFAGLVAFVDASEGYHVSPSNHVIAGITGLEMPITWDFTDATGTTDANNLNANGIITIANGVGTGYLAWGNSSSYFPANTTPDQFLCVQRTRDMLEESIAFAMRPFADKPISLAQIDSILETVNAFIRTLIARGALMDGSNCILDPEQNTPEGLAAGQVVFFIDFMPPTPAQRFTFNSYMDTSLLASILGGNNPGH
jgi:uncharacterized protein